MSGLRVAYGVLLVTAFFGTEHLRLKIRSAVYASGNGPRWFFDTIGNSGGAISLVLVLLLRTILGDRPPFSVESSAGSL